MHDFCGDYHLLLKSVKDVDLVFNPLHGGDGENGTIQKFLESQKVKFTGSSSLASKIAMSKHEAKDICLKNAIPTPDYFMCWSNFKKSAAERFYFDACNFPNGYVIKPNSEGSSIGISININSQDSSEKSKQLFIKGWKKAKETCKNVYDKGWPTIVEEYIEGRELTVSILDDKVLPIVEIIPKGDYYDYKCKYSKFQSNYVVPAKIDKKTQELLSAYSLKIHKLIGCGEYSRVDFRLSVDGKIYFLEINTLPGFTDTSLFPKSATAYGLGYKELIKKIIEIT